MATEAEHKTTGVRRNGGRPIPSGTYGERVAVLDWHSIESDLDRHGSALIPHLLGAAECDALVKSYPCDDFYRSMIVMARHGFGRG